MKFECNAATTKTLCRELGAVSFAGSSGSGVPISGLRLSLSIMQPLPETSLETLAGGTDQAGDTARGTQEQEQVASTISSPNPLVSSLSWGNADVHALHGPYRVPIVEVLSRACFLAPGRQADEEGVVGSQRLAAS